MTILLCAVAVFVPMIAEAMLSRAHDRQLRAAGAIEPAGDVYRVMQAAYPGAFLVLFAEGLWRGPASGVAMTASIAIFAMAKALKYWAIAALGTRWTFRVLVPPNAPLVAAGPYRWLRHPNYVAVAGELAAVSIAMRAVVSGPFAVAGFGWLMLRRVRVEERALALRPE
jgi:methyltransferase